MDKFLHFSRPLVNAHTLPVVRSGHEIVRVTEIAMDCAGNHIFYPSDDYMNIDSERERIVQLRTRLSKLNVENWGYPVAWSAIIIPSELIDANAIEVYRLENQSNLESRSQTLANLSGDWMFRPLGIAAVSSNAAEFVIACTPEPALLPGGRSTLRSAQDYWKQRVVSEFHFIVMFAETGNPMSHDLEGISFMQFLRYIKECCSASYEVIAFVATKVF